MNLAFLVANQSLSMLLIILSGAVLAKTGLIDEKNSKCISSLTANLLTPAMLLHSFQIAFEHDKLVGLCFVVGVTILSFVVAVGCSRLVSLRGENPNVQVERCCVVYSNSGSIGMPLIAATLGQESVFYATGFLMIFNICLWTHGVSLISGDKKALSLKKLLLNPNLLAIFLGLAMFLTGVRFPSIIGSAVASLNNAIMPVSLVLVGINLGSTSLKRLVGTPRAYFICFLRLILLPGLLILLFSALRLSALLPNAKQLLEVSLICMLPSVASSVTMLSHLYDREASYASLITVLSNLLAILTMPFMVAFADFML